MRLMLHCFCSWELPCVIGCEALLTVELETRTSVLSGKRILDVPLGRRTPCATRYDASDKMRLDKKTVRMPLKAVS